MSSGNLFNISTSVDAVAECLASGLPPIRVEVGKEPIPGSRLEFRDRRNWTVMFPYTCAAPSAECLNALSKGDCVDVSFSWTPPSGSLNIYGTSVSFDVISADAEWIVGTLTKGRLGWQDPLEGKVVQVPKWAIKEVKFADPQKNELLRECPRIKYADYCVIDRRVSFDELKVQYVYRQEPCLTMEGDKAPDSGWRIKGDRRGIFGAESWSYETVRYQPLCCALDSDDSWLHLIDKPVGTAFKRDRKTGLFVEVKAPRSTLSPGEAELWRECEYS